MNVIQPLMLLLLAGVAVPIIVHLYNRRKAVTRRFPALEFLLRSNQKLARSLKVRQLLMLLLRVGVFLLIPLALAKPYIPSDEGTSAEDRLPSAVVFILDDSLTMAALDDDSTRYERARDSLLERLAALERYDEASVIFSSTPTEPPFASLVDDVSVLEREVSEHIPTQLRGDLRRSLETARELLLSAKQPVRKVVILTDLTQSSWPDTLGAALLDTSVNVEVVSLRPDDAPTFNASIAEVGYQSSAQGLANTFDVWCEVAGHAFDEPREVVVTLRHDGDDVAEAVATLQPGQRERVTFAYQLSEPVVTTLSFHLTAQDDRLPADDVARITVQPRRSLTALLINGDPRPLRYQDELFYLERALQPSGESRSLITPRVTTPKGFRGTDLNSVDVVVLANVAALSPAQAGMLQTFVEEGGGLLITMGDQVEIDTYNRLFNGLLPKPLRSVKQLANPDDPDAAIKVTRFDRTEYTHPALAAFSLPGGDALQKVMVYTYTLVQPSAQSKGRVLVAYADGAPALLERPVGKGRVMLLTTTIDRDWTGLAIRKSFLPLIRRSLRYLSRSISGGETQAWVGQPHRLRFDTTPVRVVVTQPDGERMVLSRAELENMDDRPVVTPTQAGVYQVAVQDVNTPEPVPAQDFVANIDPAGADTTPIEVAALEPLWQAPSSDAAIADSPYAGRERRVELWPLLLLVALICLYLETLVGFRRSFLSKLARLGRSS